MNLLDVAFLLVLGVSVAGGLVRGLIREILGLAGLAAGFLLALFLAPVVAAQLERWMVPAAAYALGFLGIFFFVVVVAGILGHVLTRFMEGLNLSCLNRLGGGLFGLVRGAILLVVLLWGLLFFVDRPERLIGSSKLAPLVYRGAVWFGRMLPGHRTPTEDEMI